MTPEEEARILAEHKARLYSHEYGADRYADLIHIASVITSACRDLALEIPVIVGGLAVETYTMGAYSTSDIDLIVTSESRIHAVMTGLGFERRVGYRYWCHPLFGDVVELPTPPLDGDPDRVTVVQFENGEECLFLGIEDVILGRLEEFVHWDKKRLDSHSAVQLRLLLRSQEENIDFEYLREQSRSRKLQDALDLVQANMD